MMAMSLMVMTYAKVNHFPSSVHTLILYCFSDVDECDTDRHNCSLNADCINGLGNFSCECRVGYSGDGVNCSK